MKNLLQQLQEDERDLQHTGETLYCIVNVLLKTTNEGDIKESMIKFIH